MSSSQPIALPAHPYADSRESYPALGSYTSPNGSFNPASYTRHFLGSPLSWRGGSFGSRYYPPGSPDHAFGPLEYAPFLCFLIKLIVLSDPSPNDSRCEKLSSSIESDRGSVVNAFNVFDGDFVCSLSIAPFHHFLLGVSVPKLHMLRS
jgi:transcription factor SFP1